MTAIETSGLTKVYSGSFGRKKVQALIDFDLSVSPGTIFGLLGPNGAGKTTLIKLLLGIIFPTAGSGKILGHDVSQYKVKSRVGYLPENHKYPAYLNGGEVLNFYGRLSGLEGNDLSKKIDELLELVQLGKWKKTKIKAYSKGMMQRLGIAQALINDPELIFLDEPTDGVDPIGRKEIRDILIKLKEQNKTIFLNSHLLSEVELITDRVGILNKGKLIREGTVKELTEKAEEFRVVVDSDENIAGLANDGILVTSSGKRSFAVKVKTLAELNVLIDSVRQKGILIKEVVPQKFSLEDMFINLIQQSESLEDKK